ncbi:MAG: hypothetical protein HIU85_06605 [Proteobacteria bacterium]|nr:hypothetical protein [Pseudomonadota bacterium]
MAKRKSRQSDAEKRLAAKFAEMEPDRRILTSADQEYIRGLLRRGFSPEQIVPVFTADKYQEPDVRAVIEAATAPKPATSTAQSPAPGSILARFPGRPADTEPLKAAGLKWDRDRKVWAGPDTEAARAAIAALGGSVEGAA